MARNTWVQLYNDDARGLSTDGFTLATFTTSAALFPAVVFPANYFKTGKLLHLRARGVYSTTATPAYTFRLQETAGTIVTIVTGAAITMPSTVTNMAWEADIQIQCRTEGVTGTLLAQGDFNYGTAATTSATRYFPESGTAPATATVDTTIQQTWQWEVASGTSSASNTLKGIILELKTIN